MSVGEQLTVAVIGSFNVSSSNNISQVTNPVAVITKLSNGYYNISVGGGGDGHLLLSSGNTLYASDFTSSDTNVVSQFSAMMSCALKTTGIFSFAPVAGVELVDSLDFAYLPLSPIIESAKVNNINLVASSNNSLNPGSITLKILSVGKNTDLYVLGSDEQFYPAISHIPDAVNYYDMQITFTAAMGVTYYLMVKDGTDRIWTTIDIEEDDPVVTP